MPTYQVSDLIEVKYLTSNQFAPIRVALILPIYVEWEPVIREKKFQDFVVVVRQHSVGSVLAVFEQNN